MTARALFLALLASACAAEPGGAEAGRLGGRLLPTPAGAESGPAGEAVAGPPVRGGGACAAWAVTRAWTQVGAGRRTWEEIYATWVARIAPPGDHRSGDRPVPADSPLLLRAAFASRYALPFFIQGWDGRAGRLVYVGHFGVIDRAHRCVTIAAERSGPAGLETLFPGWRARHLARLLHAAFDGSNLADDANTFHLRPRHILPGDLLLERWDRKGPGHTMSVVDVRYVPAAAMVAELLLPGTAGALPVRASPAQSRWYFTLPTTGGVGEGTDGTPYAALGGGVRRWRAAVARDGRWWNVVLEAHAAAFLHPREEREIAARPDRFAQLLASEEPGALAPLRPRMLPASSERPPSGHLR